MSDNRDTPAEASIANRDANDSVSHSATSPSLLTSYPSSTSKKEFQRSFKACDGCRIKKVKCDLGSLEAPSEPPCSRCKREMRQCVFTMSTRGRGSKPRSSRVRSEAFGAHHLAKLVSPASLSSATAADDSNHTGSTSAIDALAGAALSMLPDSSFRHHSTCHDVPVTDLDPFNVPSIGMIYGLSHQRAIPIRDNGSPTTEPTQPTFKKRRTSLSVEPSNSYTSNTSLPKPGYETEADTDDHDHEGDDDDVHVPEENGETNHGNNSHERTYQMEQQHDDPHNSHNSPTQLNTQPEGIPIESSPTQDDASDMSESTHQRSATLQQYAKFGLQHSKDALRVLAGVAVESSQASLDHASDPNTSQAAIDDVNDPASHASPTESNHPPPPPPPPTSSSSSPTDTRTLPSNQASLHLYRRPAAAMAVSRPVTPPPLKHEYGWSKFEPIRLKLIKRSAAKYFLNFFIRRMHAFAPHCSPHLLDRSPEALSELFCREPILLGAMLSVASRYDVANHNAHVIAIDTFHRKISKWTQEKISRSFFLPQSHTIGTIEALLILSEWATLDLHDRRTSPDASSESEDEADENDTMMDDELPDASAAIDADEANRNTTLPNGHSAEPIASSSATSAVPATHPRRVSTKSQQQQQQQQHQHQPTQLRPPKSDLRESEKFDDTAWMLTGTALRLAERLDLNNDVTYSGISNPNLVSRRNAERRMRVWMSSVHADCHLSVRLGRRISSPGLSAPFMNLVRDRTHPFLLRSDTSGSTGLSDSGYTTSSPRAWIAFRAHSELLQIVFRTCENLYRSKAVTERLLEDEDFVPALKSIRDDLDNWANWTQPRIEPIHDMTSLRLRVEYHYARLYANGIALDSFKQSLGTMRPHRQKRDEIGGIHSVGFSTHPAYPFVREALASAQSLIRILTVELESMMCAPARWFLLLVMAAVFCVKATAVSDSILPLQRCAQSLQQVISALTKASPDGVHLANRYSMYLRRLAKQLVLTDAKSRSSANQRSRSKEGSASRSKSGSSSTTVGGVGNASGIETATATATAAAASIASPSWTGGAQATEHRGSNTNTNANANQEHAEFHPTRVQSYCYPISTLPVASRPDGLKDMRSMTETNLPYNSGKVDTQQQQQQRHHLYQHESLLPSQQQKGQPQPQQRNGAESPASPVRPGPSSWARNSHAAAQGGGGSWWSTADVLLGEVDLQLFLKWLDEHSPPVSCTCSNSSLQQNSLGWWSSGSNHGDKSTATGICAAHSSSPAQTRTVRKESVNGMAAFAATSPVVRSGTRMDIGQQEPSAFASLMTNTPSAKIQGDPIANDHVSMASTVGASHHVAHHHSSQFLHHGGQVLQEQRQSRHQAHIHPPPPPPPLSSMDMVASSSSAAQDDLLTKMWLDDALNDLASVGLDMPFL